MRFLSYFSKWLKSRKRPRRQWRGFRYPSRARKHRLTPSAMLAPTNIPVQAATAGSSATTSTNQNLYVTNGQLPLVNGDQLGYGYSDTITIDTNAGGGVYVNMNGKTASFGYGQITSIVVNTGTGDNGVYVNNEAAGVPLTINDGGNDYVHIGSYGNAQGIRGSVSISDPSYYTNLFIDDSADSFGRSVWVNSTYVTGLTYSPIFFHYNDLSLLPSRAARAATTSTSWDSIDLHRLKRGLYPDPERQRQRYRQRAGHGRGILSRRWCT